EHDAGNHRTDEASRMRSAIDTWNVPFSKRRKVGRESSWSVSRERQIVAADDVLRRASAGARVAIRRRRDSLSPRSVSDSSMTARQERCRMITVEVRTPVDLERLVVDRRRLLLYPQTRIRARPGEMVLLDVRVGERRIVIWARAHFTVPEGRGPLFACATADRGVLYTL